MSDSRSPSNASAPGGLSVPAGRGTRQNRASSIPENASRPDLMRTGSSMEETVPRFGAFSSVNKFGGTSMEDIPRVASIGCMQLERSKRRVAMVVSALYKVTDMLDNIVTLATQGKAEESRKELHKVRDHHLERARRLFGESKEVYDEYAAMLNRDCETIPSILSAVVLSRRRVSFVPDVVMGHGEIWSMRLLHGYMRANAAKLNIKPEGVITIDARDVLTLKRSSEFETALTELDISRRKVNLDAIDLETSQRLLDERLAANPNAEILIIPGFVCRSYEGSPTTLGRNASDFSAAIFGYLLDVTGIFIWKEEDGVFTADPRVLGKDNIHLVSFMSYHEVAELANFGGKVLHGSTMEPALKKRIPIHLRSTYNLEHSGTRIGGDARDIPVNTVKAVSSINVSMISINVHPSAHAAVGKSIMEGLLAVEAEPLQVVFSKFESKYTLLVAREDEAKVINQLTSKQLYGEIARREVEPPRTTGKPMSVVAAVGQGITHLEAQFFRAFKNSGIHLYMISHTPRSISVVIPESEVRRAITAVHDAFFKRNLVSLVVLSDANNVINDVFLRLVHAHYKKEGKNRRLAVRGVYDCVAARIVLDEKVLDAAFQAAEPPRWNDLLSSAAAKPFDANEADIKSLVASVYRGHYLHSTIVDISDRVECNALYAPLVGEGFDLISLNRGALNAPAPRPQESPKASAKSADMAGEERKGGDEAAATASGGGGVAEDDVFEVLELREDEGAAEALVKRRDGMRQIDLLLQLERLHGFNFMYDSAICPGVPLVSTIRDMRQRGDRILRVELNVSVSVQAALAALRSGKVASFSEAVRASREFLEPDPRTDLSGTFVAEKARILGRELAARVQLEVEQLLPDRLKVTSQSPATWEPIAPDAVLDSLREIDDVVGKRFKAAESKGSRLVYVAELQVTMDEAGNDVARGKLLLREYPASHPFASTSTLVQAIAIESERTEGRSPIFLVYPAANTLQGALGVFGDTLTLTSIADTR